jgi:hypothetical protein
MAGHELIDRELRILARRLPAPVVEEVADGLAETYRAELDRLGDPDSAARAALAEFGDADTVSAAFVRVAPGRATARLLLALGPIVGGGWAAVLVTGRAWTWAVPGPAWTAGGTALAVVVVALALAVVTRCHYRAVRLSALGGAFGLVLLDIAAITMAVIVAVPDVGVVCAMAGSLARIGLVTRALIGYR